MRKRPAAWAALLFFLFLWIFPAESLFRTPQVEQKAQGQVVGCVTGRTKKKEKQQLDLEECRIQYEANTLEAAHILVYLTDEADYPVGSVLSLSGTIYPIEKPTNPGQFDSQSYYEGKGIVCTVYAEQAMIIGERRMPVRKTLITIRERLEAVYETAIGGSYGEVIKAMVLGQKAGLDQEIKERYQKNGISHLLAISGLHISLIGMGLYRILRKLTGHVWTAGIPAILFTTAYGWMSGASVSALRAVVMCSLMMTADLLGRTYDMLTALGIGALLFLGKVPAESRQSAFLLSFGAVLGIGLLQPLWKLYWSDMGRLRSSVSISFSVTAVTFPMLLVFFCEYPLHSTILNLMVIPLMSILMLCGLACGMVGLLWLPPARLLAVPCRWILWFYDTAGSICLKLPGAVLSIGKPAAWKILFYYLVLAAGVWMLYREKKRKKYSKDPKRFVPDQKKARLCGAGLWFAILILCIHIHTGLEVTMLDVGQGDCVFFQSADGTTFLSDGGSSNVSSVGTYRILPFLKAKGERQIDYLFLSHMDQDHISGIQELVEETRKDGSLRIGTAVFPAIGKKDEAYEEMEQLFQEAGISVCYMGRGDLLKSKTVSIRCLWPEKQSVSEDRNEQSLVLLAEYGQFQMLLTGDIGEETEEKLLQAGELQQVEVLKAAHHGSRYASSAAFLDAVRPCVSLISCSKTNRYGHPGAETLERLEKAGSRIFVTKDCGAITVWTNGKKVRLRSYIDS